MVGFWVFLRPGGINVSADAGSGTTRSPDNLRKEIRLAVVMTGGVKLAIWMGGMARELNLLLRSRNIVSTLAGRSTAITRAFVTS